MKWNDRLYHLANSRFSLGYLIIWLTPAEVQWSKTGEILHAVCDKIFMIRTVYTFLAPSLTQLLCIVNAENIRLNFLYVYVWGSKISFCVWNEKKLRQGLKT